MTEQTLTVLLGTPLVAVLGYLFRQVHKSAVKIDRVRSENHALWRYTRGLIDQVYKLGGIPVEPPESINSLYKNGEPE